MVVAGGFSNVPAVQVLCSRVPEVLVYDSVEEYCRPSAITGRPVHVLPHLPRNARVVKPDEYHCPLSLLVHCRPVNLPCLTFARAARILAAEPYLRQVLKGRRYVPIGRYRDTLAVEIA